MEIHEAIENSNSMLEAARKLNMPFSTFKRKAGDAYRPNQGGRGSKKQFKRNGYSGVLLTSEILSGSRPQYPTNNLKKRLLKEGVFSNVCAKCGFCGLWNGMPLTLHLDHINGINNDHRISNLQLLCPNCHSQTPTYAGKNKRKNFKQRSGSRTHDGTCLEHKRGL